MLVAPTRPVRAVVRPGRTNAAGNRVASQWVALRLVIVPGVAVVSVFRGLGQFATID